MGKGYGCSNFQCSTQATAIKFIHSCRRAAVVHQIRKPFCNSIDGSQRTVHNSWVTMHALHVK